eukprot:gene37198-45152_t
MSAIVRPSYFNMESHNLHESLDSMEGLKPCTPCDLHSTTFPQLISNLNKVFDKKKEWGCRKECLTKLVQNIELEQTEWSKYCYCSNDLPYTRNLIYTDNKHYTLLLLCWTAGYESKIHNHPCDGCFVKVLDGRIKESKYSISPEGEVTLDRELIAGKGAMSYMDDSLGLHKIGNPDSRINAVTLHIYTPPYKSCKVWTDTGLTEPLEGRMFHFSEMGTRTVQPTEEDIAYYI